VPTLAIPGASADHSDSHRIVFARPPSGIADAARTPALFAPRASLTFLPI
jgi:hypothetical protein